MIIACALLALSTLPAFPEERPRPAISTNTSYGDNVITHIVDGENWKTAITVVNLSSANAAAYTLKFYGEDGTSKEFPFLGIGSFSVLTGTLAPAGSVVIRTRGFTTDPTARVGWAQFDYTSSGNISGYAVFTHRSGQEAVVPFESDIVGQQVLAYDNTNGIGMGVALVNSNSLSSVLNVSATFRDENGTIISTDIFTMNSLTHQSFVLKDK